MEITWSPDPIRAGQPAQLRILLTEGEQPGDYTFSFGPSESPFDVGGVPSAEITHRMRRGQDFQPEVLFTSAGDKELVATPPRQNPNPPVKIPVEEPLAPQVPQTTVALVAADPPASEDAILWTFINEITNRLRFDEFHEFVRPRLTGTNGPEWYGTDAYRRLRRLADEFVETAADPLGAIEADKPTVRNELSLATVEAGIARSYVSSERGDLARPFLRVDTPTGTASKTGGARQGKQRGKQAAAVREAVESALTLGQFPLPNVPFVELIWNYWHEEAALVQSMNHILARFQNRRVGPGHSALARFDLNPLLPLRNLLWGFAEDERRRLTVRRRAAEYEYQYGLQLLGRAVPPASLIVESRTQFLEAFHGLLNAGFAFYKERDDKTVDADAFPLLSSLREVHLVLARGAHNQFADLPVTARAEMLTMQWILAQPEMREFLGGPTMVPYEEPWMDRVDTMKTLLGWSDASVTHFFELAVHGEQILLSVRHGRWNESSRTREDAANWALTWRNEIQRYLHAYRTVTGIDLATGLDATMPSLLLARRMRRQARRA